ncbi:hypothetical protein BDK51DRAFT_53240 [Blyttiomyces helicus]|uniref:RRM domain-containing protein n=1 Tax=Blyttiomyces helicus TaxID=388810 RepID=A0A4P9W4K0_9FUNG|nr:hypothetical protein BDK51DRAFT_53240 [Blyttiomyces helicus]|eukprot:RKO87281.1 hypothetical protein BDK51DRAFT_53240 [Blyttiomyces helicus]
MPYNKVYIGKALNPRPQTLWAGQKPEHNLSHRSCSHANTFGKLARLSSYASEEDRFGPVRKVYKINHYAFVTFCDEQDAARCVRELDGEEFMNDTRLTLSLFGGSLYVEPAKAQSPLRDDLARDYDRGRGDRDGFQDRDRYRGRDIDRRGSDRDRHHQSDQSGSRHNGRDRESDRSRHRDRDDFRDRRDRDDDRDRIRDPVRHRESHRDHNDVRIHERDRHRESDRDHNDVRIHERDRHRESHRDHNDVRIHERDHQRDPERHQETHRDRDRRRSLSTADHHASLRARVSGLPDGMSRKELRDILSTAGRIRNMTEFNEEGEIIVEFETIEPYRRSHWPVPAPRPYDPNSPPSGAVLRAMGTADVMGAVSFKVRGSQA